MCIRDSQEIDSSNLEDQTLPPSMNQSMLFKRIF